MSEPELVNLESELAAARVEVPKAPAPHVELEVPPPSPQPTVEVPPDPLAHVDVPKGTPARIIRKARELAQRIAKGEPLESLRLYPIKCSGGEWYLGKLTREYRLVVRRTDAGFVPWEVLPRERFTISEWRANR